MSAGTVVGSVVTLFGTVAGAALVAQGIHPELGINVLPAWIVFILCFGAGVLMLQMFSFQRGTPLAMQVPGVIAILLGLTAGAAGLAKAMGILPLDGSLSLWLMLVLTLPPGVLLMTGAAGLSNIPAPELK